MLPVLAACREQYGAVGGDKQEGDYLNTAFPAFAF
jgi:hypothetical protein